jgi:hypothetical protein
MNLPTNEQGFIRVGGPISSTTVALRVGGDELEPDEITALLGCAPTRSHRKGDVTVGKSTGKKHLKKSGMWSLAANKTNKDDLDKKILALLDQVTDDLHIWRNINNRFSVDIFSGLFMDQSNEGLAISASTLAMLGERGMKLQFDIYGPAFDDELEDHFESAKLKKNQPLN